ncbi:hypothetical protein Tco_0364619 [Tanacetum coccineum]
MSPYRWSIVASFENVESIIACHTAKSFDSRTDFERTRRVFPEFANLQTMGTIQHEEQPIQEFERNVPGFPCSEVILMRVLNRGKMIRRGQYSLLLFLSSMTTANSWSRKDPPTSVLALASFLSEEILYSRIKGWLLLGPRTMGIWKSTKDHRGYNRNVPASLFEHLVHEGQWKMVLSGSLIQLSIVDAHSPPY